MKLAYALLVFCACSGESLTAIHIDITADQAWKVDRLHITIGERAPVERPLEDVEIVVPDEMAGVSTPIQIAASSANVTVASGKVDVTPELHDDVFYTLALQPLSCGSSCTIGAKMCSGNGVATCERQPNGCGAWSQPATCSAATPYCTDGECTSTQQVQVTTGALHTCAKRGDGSVLCWGGNSYGQSMPPASTFKSIVAGWYFTCGIRLDDTIACWGDSQLTTPPTGAFVKISAGAYHACAQRADNTYTCWGNSTSSRYAFTESRYLSIAAGSEHSCAIRTADGALSCVGLNSYMQISPLPSGTYTRVDGGDAHTCAQRADGTITCWGYSVAIAGTPTTTFDSFAVGSTNACAIKGTALTCWGNDQYGQTTAPPGQYRSVAPGGRHTCAVRMDNTVACWGSNTDGQSTVPAL